MRMRCGQVCPIGLALLAIMVLTNAPSYAGTDFIAPAPVPELGGSILTGLSVASAAVLILKARRKK